MKFRSDDGATVDAFGFGLGGCAEWIAERPGVDVVFELGSSQFNGFESLELRVSDLREASGVRRQASGEVREVGTQHSALSTQYSVGAQHS